MSLPRLVQDPLDNPHSSNPRVHYRLYLTDLPRNVCVQDFDYHDYDDNRFLSTRSYDSESDADIALNAMIDMVLATATADDVMRINALVRLDRPITRAQALVLAVLDHKPNSGFPYYD